MKTEGTRGSSSQKQNQPTGLQGGRKTPIQKALQKVESLPNNLNISTHQVMKKSSSVAMLGDNFTKSLIDRIRGVSRSPQKQSQINKTVSMTPSSTSKLQKSSQNYISIKEKFHLKTQHFPTEITFRSNTCQRQENNRMIITLEGKVKELEQKNKELLEKIEDYDCEMFISRQQIEQLIYDIQCKDNAIKELEEYIQERQEHYKDNQNKIQQDYNTLRQQYEELCEEMDRRQLTQVIKASSSQFTIQSVLQEKFTYSLEKLSLQKANSEIASLKKCISSLEKTFKSSYNQLKQQKDKEISEMRRSFAKNLSHYKQIIMKVTTKTLNDTKKGREELHQTAITENSSNQEIDEQ